jgi:hypothetical protein
MLIFNAWFHWLLLLLAAQRVTRCITAMTKSGIGFIQNSVLLTIVR